MGVGEEAPAGDGGDGHQHPPEKTGAEAGECEGPQARTGSATIYQSTGWLRARRRGGVPTSEEQVGEPWTAVDAAEAVAPEEEVELEGGGAASGFDLQDLAESLPEVEDPDCDGEGAGEVGDGEVGEAAGPATNDPAPAPRTFTFVARDLTLLGGDPERGVQAGVMEEEEVEGTERGGGRGEGITPEGDPSPGEGVVMNAGEVLAALRRGLGGDLPGRGQGLEAAGSGEGAAAEEPAVRVLTSLDLALLESQDPTATQSQQQREDDPDPLPPMDDDGGIFDEGFPEEAMVQQPEEEEEEVVVVVREETQPPPQPAKQARGLKRGGRSRGTATEASKSPEAPVQASASVKGRGAAKKQVKDDVAPEPSNRGGGGRKTRRREEPAEEDAVVVPQKRARARAGSSRAGVRTEAPPKAVLPTPVDRSHLRRRKGEANTPAGHPESVEQAVPGVGAEVEEGCARVNQSRFQPGVNQNQRQFY